MGIKNIKFLDKLRGKKERGNWQDAYIATPQFYAKPNGDPLGLFVLTEDTDTVLPKAPQYAIDAIPLTVYRMALVSLTQNSVLGYVEYHIALKALEQYAVDADDHSILIRGLTIVELIDVFNQCNGRAIK